ncbi:hypothetical protein Tco_0223247 [Tanacetum coccineum]
MLAPGNNVKWKSKINRYIDTKPNNEFIQYCLQNPPYKFKWTEKIVPDVEGIDNDIYSIFDACPNACEMWIAIERLKQGKSINVQDLKTNLYWEFKKLTSRDGESLESYYSRFYKMMNELVRNKCNVTNHQVNVQFLLQLQLEWQRSQQAATKNRGKVIVNSPPPTYDQEPEMVTKDDAFSKEKDIDKLIALISLSFNKIYKPTNNNLRTSSNTSRANQDNTSRINRGTGYDNQRVVNVAKARENVDTQVIQEVTLDAADNFGSIFDAEPLQKVQNNNDNYNMFDNESEHPEQTESVNDTYPDEQCDTNIPTDSLDMSNNGGHVDQDKDDDLARECDLLASLFDKLKCKIDERKNQNNLLELSNKNLVDKLKGTDI